jgi:hypothetical protein
MVALKQDYSKGLIIGLGMVFIIVPAVFIVLRVFAKQLGRRRLALEDYLCLAALVSLKRVLPKMPTKDHLGNRHYMLNTPDSWYVRLHFPSTFINGVGSRST